MPNPAELLIQRFNKILEAPPPQFSVQTTKCDVEGQGIEFIINSETHSTKWHWFDLRGYHIVPTNIIGRAVPHHKLRRIIVLTRSALLYSKKSASLNVTKVMSVENREQE